jgi:hypothetical protein
MPLLAGKPEFAQTPPGLRLMGPWIWGEVTG